ncbi:MAG TPA: helix-turn-helix domain-containing protein [Actinomycetota bacterium]|nr:helix-turn-helix domain-containing protein [Actinomycetota bacterium]
MHRRPATMDEAKALANPLRLRILRLTLDQALTNKQLAERLDRDPGTVLHHVRRLVDTGFLVAEEVRQGDKGALEKPYRATGKSWTLSLDASPAVEADATQAMLDAFLAELAEAGPGAARDFTRLALTLDDASLKELQHRLREVFDDFAARPPDPGGRRYGLLFAMHLLAEPGPGAQPSEPSGSGGVDPTS